jgi:hypothetical protein
MRYRTKQGLLELQAARNLIYHDSLQRKPYSYCNRFPWIVINSRRE